MNFKSKKFLVFSNKGGLTVQFMFGFALVWFFIMIFAVMIYVLFMSSVAQYITYASARNLFLSHLNLAIQKKAAQDKYMELTSKFSGSTLKLFSPETIMIDEVPNLELNPNFQVSGSNPNLFYGVWTNFTPKILNVKTFFGNIQEEDNVLKTSIGSYLGREPSYEEYKKFDRDRWNEIKKGYNVYPSTPPPLVFDSM